MQKQRWPMLFAVLGLVVGSLVLWGGAVAAHSTTPDQLVQSTVSAVHHIDPAQYSTIARSAPPADTQAAGQPDGGATGTSSTFMSVSPDVISRSIASGVSTVASGFTAGETVNYYVNGVLTLTAAADSNGRFATLINSGSSTGYYTVLATGQSSGKSAGGVYQVQDAEVPVPGLAIAPHAVNPTGSTTLLLVGSRWKPNTTVTLARNNTVVGTVTSSGSGTFSLNLTVSAGSNMAAVYNAYTTTTGSLVGQSIEERSDAGTATQILRASSPVPLCLRRVPIMLI